MIYNKNKPYNELPLLPPQKDLETKRVLKKTVNVSRALAELKGLGKTIPNQAILIDSLILQEAKASSEIENIITTHDALYKAFSANTMHIDSATKEVLQYREALWHGYNILKQRSILTTNIFIEIVQIIKQNRSGIRSVPGTTIANAKTGEVIYTPPEGESVIRNKLKNLEDYIHADDNTDPLIKLPVIHYQFEAIHPFSDGNGRTGRILNILYLLNNNLLELPVLYLSKAIIERKSEYYKLLNRVTTKEDWETWILFMLNAIEETANFTCKRILDINELMDETMDKARKELSSRVYSKELIEMIFRQPYCKIAFLVDEGIAQRQTAAEYLKELENIDVLKSQKVGRETLYLNWKLYNLLAGK